MIRKLVLLLTLLTLPTLVYGQGITNTKVVIITPVSVTTAANGGGTAASQTLTTAETGFIIETCQDTDGCTMTMSESGARNGQVISVIMASSSNTCTWNNIAGQQELAGGAAFAGAASASISFQYSTDRWVEITRGAPGGFSGSFFVAAVGTSGSPSYSFTGFSADGFYHPSSGNVGLTTSLLPSVTASKNLGSSSLMFGDTYTRRLAIGNNTPAFTSPVSVVRLNQSDSAQSATYTGFRVDSNISASAPYANTFRASEIYGVFSGTQNVTGEADGAIFGIDNSTSGTVTSENGFISSIARTGGPSTNSYGIRVDRSYAGAFTSAASEGVVIGAPGVSGGHVLTNVVGLGISSQTTTGTASANALDIAAGLDNSGQWSVYADGAVAHVATMTSAAVLDTHGAFAVDVWNYTGADTSGGRGGRLATFNITPSANLTKSFSANGSSLNFKGTHSTSSSLFGNYGYAEMDDTATMTTTVATGYLSGVDGEFGNYSTTTLPVATGLSCSHGTGTGATTTLAACALIDVPWDTTGTETAAVGVEILNQTFPGTAIANNWAVRYHAPNGDSGIRADGLHTSMVSTFANLPTCNSAAEGGQQAVTNSNTNTWGATISGTGANHVLAYCDGTNWTVMGK